MGKVLVTGGLGFIGSNFVRYILQETSYDITNVDKLTYAGNPANLNDIENNSRYTFVKGDICDKELMNHLVSRCEVVVNFAAESHVDRSILDPDAFVKTDIMGTHNLLEAVRANGKRLVHISTDEVYGSKMEGEFDEEAPLCPSSPYSSTKAGADLLCRAYYKTYKTDVVITRSSNNYGPYQHPEKFIPLFITNAIEGKNLPLYGTGENVRDWLHVEDNCSAILTIMEKGKAGEVYNITSKNERKNADVAKLIVEELGAPASLITFVDDRPAHDFRYAITNNRLLALGWKSRWEFEDGLKQTIEWYKNHQKWWKKIKAGEFGVYYKKQYRK